MNDSASAPPKVDDRCKCAEHTDVHAPWPYMGPWHEPGCWLAADHNGAAPLGLMAAWTNEETA